MKPAKHCLIVDDSDIIRKVARVLLERLGYQVSEARNGEEALAFAELGMPDLILLDWHMPGLPPRYTIEQIRRLRSNRRPTVVYMTSEHNMEDIAEAKKSGADDYLLTPFDRVAFEGKINELAMHA
ncbi:MAG: PleD family two-component system response regulator [Hyphomicrobiaceae bacterium]